MHYVFTLALGTNEVVLPVRVWVSQMVPAARMQYFLGKTQGFSSRLKTDERPIL